MENYLRLQTADFARALSADAELKELIRWIFEDGNEKLESMLLARLDSVKNKWVEQFYRELLLKSDLSFELMSAIIESLMDNGFILEAEVVAQDRYKKVFICLPEAYYKLPRVLRDAVSNCVCDIIYTDEEPNIYLERLRWLIDSLVTLDENGKLKFARAQLDKVSRLRSTRTLVGVMLAKVYDDDENPKEVALYRYGLNARTFDKYYRVVFGTADEEKSFDREYAKHKEEEDVYPDDDGDDDDLS
jgi:hypothetical protein